MHLDGAYTFEAARQRVWDALQDPDVIAGCMPGCERFEQIGEDRYEATMKIGIGPVRGTYSGRIFLRDRAEPERFVMEVEGGGSPGHMKGVGTLYLESRDGQTLVRYDGDAEVTGKIASVGQRLLGASAKQLINLFFKSMERQVAADGQTPEEREGTET